MATPVFCCGFECGQAGSAGQHWALAAGLSFDTTIKRNGNRSLKGLNVGDSFSATAGITFSNNILVGRFYVYIVSMPVGDDLRLARTGANILGILLKSDGKIYSESTVPGSTPVTVTTNRWYRIDFKFDMSNNPWTCEVLVDGVSCGQGTRAVAGNTFTQFFLNENNGGGNHEVYYDDLILSTTSADFPIGNGTVRHFVPTSDGTHTATTTTIVKGTIAAPTGGGNVAGSTDVFNRVNGVPLLGGASDNTFLVNQQTAGAGLYAEVVFGPAPNVPTPRVPPRAVEVITADREATTAAGDFTTKLNDNGTENSIIARGVVAGVITDRYARKHYALAPTGGAWTIVSGAGNFNNIRARFGYSSDATPDQYWRGIMIEAEFPEPKQKVVSINQSVNRSNTY